MKRKNWLSALLAVMMVISMVACIALPVTAEGTTDLSSLPGVLNEDGTANPTAEKAADANVDEYVINNWADLIWASKNPTLFGTKATRFTAANPYGDILHLNFDPDITKYAEEYVAFSDY